MNKQNNPYCHQVSTLKARLRQSPGDINHVMSGCAESGGSSQTPWAEPALVEDLFPSAII